MTRLNNINGWPHLVENENVLVATVDGETEWGSFERFELIQEKLDDELGEFYFLPSVEYELLASGIRKEDLSKIGRDVDLSIRVAECLKVRYLLKYSVEGARPAEIYQYSDEQYPLENGKVRLRWQIYDLLNLNVSPAFEVIASSMPIPLSSRDYVDVTGLERLTLKAINRSCREIKKGMVKAED
ncbi:hypothetical protein [Reichenbachiella ulvae]|uniref:Uncharacterized protein n=1 Tax=Reichenbachiella ulvae TaxID=2980104 RepID=A0ABT3CPY3_9BACT|nr:hypothetical protein [Reichenbachiella ulvae]MCV9385579.1 hypothetical protein [Reichenbachiella ulvae]